MKLSANFQLSELVKSQVAERKGIPNNPSPAHIDNLKALCVLMYYNQSDLILILQ
jgi:hypothetical protein